MKKQTVEFKSDPNRPGRFTSTDRGQDSLTFEGKPALYDLKTNLLKVGGVKVIKTADAFVYPPVTQPISISCPVEK
jgi:hypothetical protein